MRNYSIVGKSLPLIDAIPKVTGQAKFCADMELPGMLCSKVLRSPHPPHARILNIDASRALKLSGVRAVVTGKDTAGGKYGSGPAFCDEQGLAVDKVRYIGDEVAAVAATDEDAVEEALELRQTLEKANLLRQHGRLGNYQFFPTDLSPRFVEVGEAFLNRPLTETEKVELGPPL